MASVRALNLNIEFQKTIKQRCFSVLTAVNQLSRRPRFGFSPSLVHCSWFAVSCMPIAKTIRATAAIAPKVKKVTG